MFAILSLDYGIAHNLLCLVTWLQRALAFHSHSYHSRSNVRAGHRAIGCTTSLTFTAAATWGDGGLRVEAANLKSGPGPWIGNSVLRRVPNSKVHRTRW